MRAVEGGVNFAPMELDEFVVDFASCLKAADAKWPQAANARSKRLFQPGIGPHSEAAAVKLIAAELERYRAAVYERQISTGVPYPEMPRQKCDVCLGVKPSWEWAVEVKLLSFFGDNGKLNDNILMHILSPYPQHRSALTDCLKLSTSTLGRRKAVLIYGFDHDGWPLDPAIDAFEALACAKVHLGPRRSTSFNTLVHPIHNAGRVFGWEVSSNDRAA